MSLAIAIQFLTGRYHATPWERQVNEGVVEWPPSPWRILRSLVSAYHRLPDLPDSTASTEENRIQVCRLLTKLAEHPPSYLLPETKAAHTRHYMPVWKEGKASTTKVLDTFLLLPGGALSSEAVVQVVWQDVQIAQAERELLQRLCAQVSYLGRAESWVEMSLVQANNQVCNAVPISPEIETQSAAKRARVLAPLSSQGLKGFQQALAILPSPKKGKSWRTPTDVLETLELDIGDLHRQGWNGIPGTQWLTYTLPDFQQLIHPQSPTSALPNFARYAIESHNSGLLPNLTETVSIGERFRQALISQDKRLFNEPDPIFLGRDEAGNPSKSNHEHAWYLPEANKDNKIDRVIVYAKKGFSERSIATLQNLTRLWNKKSVIQVVLIALGDVEHYRGDCLEQAQNGLPQTSSKSLLVGAGCIWRNITPVVLPRHPKFYRNGKPQYDLVTGLQRDCPEDQIRKLLKQLEFPHELDKVQVRELDQQPQRFRLQRYLGQGAKASDRSYWFELKFVEPQKGPLALGYAAHFGLGAFIPYCLDMSN